MMETSNQIIVYPPVCFSLHFSLFFTGVPRQSTGCASVGCWPDTTVVARVLQAVSLTPPRVNLICTYRQSRDHRIHMMHDLASGRAVFRIYNVRRFSGSQPDGSANKQMISLSAPQIHRQSACLNLPDILTGIPPLFLIFCCSRWMFDICQSLCSAYICIIFLSNCQFSWIINHRFIC